MTVLILNNRPNPVVVKSIFYRYNYDINTMRTKLYKIVSLTALIVVFITLINVALAQKVEFPQDLETFAQQQGLTTENPRVITVRTIQWALGFLGLVAVIMIIYGGITWMTSAGNEKRVTQAKQIL